jgi:hypothetical protein
MESAISCRIISSRTPADSIGGDTGRSATAPSAEIALAFPLPAAAIPPTAVGRFSRGRAPAAGRRGHNNPDANGETSDSCRNDVDEDSIGSSDGSKSAAVSSSGGVPGVPTVHPRGSAARRVTSEEDRSAGSGDSSGRDAVRSEMRSRRTYTASSDRLTSPPKARVGPIMDVETTRTNRNVQVQRRRSIVRQPWVLIGHVRCNLHTSDPAGIGAHRENAARPLVHGRQTFS